MHEALNSKSNRAKVAMRWVLAVTLVVVWPGTSFGESWETLYRKGLKALEKREWLQAASYFEEAIVDARRSGPGRSSYQYIWGRSVNRDDSLNNPWMLFLTHYLGVSYANQATVCIEKGCVEESDSLARKAIPLFERSYGDPVNPAVAFSLTALGKANLKLGRSQEAEPILRRALAMYEASFSPDSNYYLPSALVNLADAYITNRKYWEAEPLLLSASENAIRILPNLPSVASPHLHGALAESQYKLACLYYGELEQPEISDTLFEKSLSVYEEDTLVDFAPEADSCFLEFESRLRTAGMYERADFVSERLQSLRDRRITTGARKE